VPITALNMVAQLCGLLEGLLAQQPQVGGRTWLTRSASPAACNAWDPAEGKIEHWGD
jgi:hypothetical protein